MNDEPILQILYVSNSKSHIEDILRGGDLNQSPAIVTAPLTKLTAT